MSSLKTHSELKIKQRVWLEQKKKKTIMLASPGITAIIFTINLHKIIETCSKFLVSINMNKVISCLEHGGHIKQTYSHHTVLPMSSLGRTGKNWAKGFTLPTLITNVSVVYSSQSWRHGSRELLHAAVIVIVRLS